jgi:hypothetical protein
LEYPHHLLFFEDMLCCNQALSDILKEIFDEDAFITPLYIYMCITFFEQFQIMRNDSPIVKFDATFNDESLIVRSFINSETSFIYSR